MFDHGERGPTQQMAAARHFIMGRAHKRRVGVAVDVLVVLRRGVKYRLLVIQLQIREFMHEPHEGAEDPQMCMVRFRPALEMGERAQVRMQIDERVLAPLDGSRAARVRTQPTLF